MRSNVVAVLLNWLVSPFRLDGSDSGGSDSSSGDSSSDSSGNGVSSASVGESVAGSSEGSSEGSSDSVESSRRRRRDTGSAEALAGLTESDYRDIPPR
jgi:hypothetical protein